MDHREQLEKARGLLAREDYREAAKIYQDILKEKPKHTLALRGMGLIALGVENIDAAEDYLQRALTQNPNQYPIWLKLGYACNRLRKPEKALQAFRNAVKLEPGKSPGYLYLGSTLLVTGKKDEAIETLKKAFLLDHESPQALRLVSSTVAIPPDDPLVREAMKWLEKSGLSAFEKADLNYGIAYVYEKAGEDKKFITYLKRANWLQKEDAPEWRPIFERNLKVLQEIFTEQSFEVTVDESLRQYSPIFIIGMPRSGTTLTEQIITSHPKVFGADEVNYMTMFIVNGVAVMTKKPYLDGINELLREQLEQLSLNYQQRMQKIAPGSQYITDKDLSNFLSIGLIKKIMPWSKVIVLWRHPMDNAFSIYRNYFPDQPLFCYDFEDMGHYYHIYREMMNHWDRVLPGFMCHVNYEDLVENFEGEARRIIDFCGLEWNDACLEPDKNKRAVMTLSQDQVRQPIYKSSIGKWKKYQQESPTIEQTKDWWTKIPNANVAIILGRGRFAVDLDGDGANGLLKAKGIELPKDAPVSKTGSGYHVFLSAKTSIPDCVGLLSANGGKP
ncbi:MAG: sulfotransferase, partial [Proteobacteria bacterium]|nr:sulfotransferase [Pseudomonadota bacterium]